LKNFPTESHAVPDGIGNSGNRRYAHTFTFHPLYEIKQLRFLFVLILKIFRCARTLFHGHGKTRGIFFVYAKREKSVWNFFNPLYISFTKKTFYEARCEGGKFTFFESSSKKKPKAYIEGLNVKLKEKMIPCCFSFT
jgi:hypothetical protein